MISLTAPGLYPFTIAALVLAGLVLAELCSLFVGHSFMALLGGHGHADGDAHGEAGALGAWMSWLNTGRVPLLVLIMIWLAMFAITGFALQAIATSFGPLLPTAVASIAALAVTLPVSKVITHWISHIIPRDESAVISQAELIGLTGTVTLGPLDQGKPGKVRVRDAYKNIHVLRARAADGHHIAQGEIVLVVENKNGTFEVIPAPDDLRAGQS